MSSKASSHHGSGSYSSRVQSKVPSTYSDGRGSAKGHSRHSRDSRRSSTKIDQEAQDRSDLIPQPSEHREAPSHALPADGERGAKSGGRKSRSNSKERASRDSRGGSLAVGHPDDYYEPSQSPGTCYSKIDAAAKLKVTLPIFSHAGAYVRPDCARKGISAQHVESHAAAIEEHIGMIDDNITVDVARSILAFEFIDHINDDILNHYLPIVDEDSSKSLGLRHDVNRLRLEDEQVNQSGWGTPSSDESISKYEDESREEVCYSGSISQSVSGSAQEQSEACGSGQQFEPEPSEQSDYSHSGVASQSFDGLSSFVAAAGEQPLSDAEDLEGLSFDGEAEAHEFLSEGDHSERSTPRKLPPMGGKHEYPSGSTLHGSTTTASLHCSNTMESLHCSNTTGSLNFSQVAPSDGCPAPPLRSFGVMSPSCSEVSFDGLLVEAESLLDGADVSNASIIGFNTTGGVNASMEAQMWPNACLITPSAASAARSNKLRAVDSIPTAGGAGGVHDIASSGRRPLTGNSYGPPLGAFGPPIILPSGMLETSSFRPAGWWNDPCHGVAPATSVYSAGASRVRRLGQHRLERMRLERVNSCALKRHQKHARESARMRGKYAIGKAPVGTGTESKAWKAGQSQSMRVALPVLQEAQTPSDSAFPKNHAILEDAAFEDRRNSCPAKTSADAPPSAGASATSEATEAGYNGKPLRKDAAGPWSARQPNRGADDSLEEYLAMQLQAESGGSRINNKQVEDRPKRNSVCPFSHLSMAASVGVDLRCGHRFNLDRLDVARMAPEICSEAGFAANGALICALCGDQDTTSLPESSKKLTTYSTNTNAYLGDLRKDYQLPLHLGGENTRASTIRPVQSAR